jgi:hypothetical protein
LLVRGNKIDLETALSEEELRHKLDLRETTGKGQVKLEEGVRPIEVFMWYIRLLRLGANSSSIFMKKGYGETFRWLSQYIWHFHRTPD